MHCRSTANVQASEVSNVFESTLFDRRGEAELNVFEARDKQIC